MPKKGYKQTKEHKDKISISSIGKKHTEETRQKIRLGNLGKKQTEESKLKIKKSKKGQIPWNKGKINIYSQETLEKMREKAIERFQNPENHPWYGIHNFGELSHAWNGGSSFLPYPPEFNKEFKQSILERDNYECQNPNCDQLSEGLDCHHIDYDKKNNILENVITLCDSCHTKTNGKKNRQYWTEFYQNIMMGKLMECLL